MFGVSDLKACGILTPQPGIEPSPDALEGKVLTTGPPGKSLTSVTILMVMVPLFRAFLVAQLVKTQPAMWETWVRALDWEDLLEKGKKGSSLQYSRLENSMDCIVHGVTQSDMISDFHFHAM